MGSYIPYLGGTDSGMGNVKLTGKLNEKQTDSMMKWQGGLKAGGMAVNAMISGFNYGLKSQEMSNQLAIAQKYYDTQDNIAGYKKEVAIKGLEVQENAILTQREMHGTQVAHEERMMELQSNMKARLAAVHENGKTARARVLATTDAFNRSNRFGGEPFMI